MNQKTPINEGGSESQTEIALLISLTEYGEVLEAQRKVLQELLTPCDYPEYPGHPKEPHAYHSGDTYDDLRSALEIYAALIDFLIDGEAALPNINAWFAEQADDAIRNDADMAELYDNDFDEPMALFACDSISSEFQTLFTRVYKARRAETGAEG